MFAVDINDNQFSRDDVRIVHFVAISCHLPRKLNSVAENIVFRDM